MERDRTELQRSCRAASRARRRDGARSTTPGRKRCGVIPREQIVALMRSQGVTRAFWEDE